MTTQPVGIISPRTVIVEKDGRLTSEGFAYFQSLRTQVADDTAGNNLDDLYYQQALAASMAPMETDDLTVLVATMAATIEGLRRRIEDLEHEVFL